MIAARRSLASTSDAVPRAHRQQSGVPAKAPTPDFHTSSQAQTEERRRRTASASSTPKSAPTTNATPISYPPGGRPGHIRVDPATDTPPVSPSWNRALAALREATPLIAILLTAFSAYIAYHSFAEARSVAREQAESSEPILVPGMPFDERGKTIGVTTEYAFVRKRADRLYLSRQAGRFIIPLRNGGSGIALTIGLPVVVQTCSDEPGVLSRTAALGQTLGSYVLPAGQ
jgi:hypothetical protein